VAHNHGQDPASSPAGPGTQPVWPPHSAVSRFYHGACPARTSKSAAQDPATPPFLPTLDLSVGTHGDLARRKRPGLLVSVEISRNVWGVWLPSGVAVVKLKSLWRDPCN